eukprot:6031644-Prymnesium_polylepis.1
MTAKPSLHRHRLGSYMWWRQRAARRRPAAASSSNEYAGARVRRSGRIPVLSTAAARRMDAVRFFRRFVATRSPVVIHAPLAELAHLEPNWWLRPSERASSVKVEVETRRSSAERFGCGVKRRMPYAEL